MPSIKASLFLSLGCVIYHYKTATIDTLQGLGQSMPLIAGLIVLGGLALIGVPLSNGFISKWYIVSVLWEAEMFWGIVIVLAGSLLSLAYVWRLLEAMYFRPAIKTTAVKLPRSMLLPCLVLSALVLYFWHHARSFD